jgi:hypothetical protein
MRGLSNHWCLLTVTRGLTPYFMKHRSNEVFLNIYNIQLTLFQFVWGQQTSLLTGLYKYDIDITNVLCNFVVLYLMCMDKEILNTIVGHRTQVYNFTVSNLVSFTNSTKWHLDKKLWRCSIREVIPSLELQNDISTEGSRTLSPKVWAFDGSASDRQFNEFVGTQCMVKLRGLQVHRITNHTQWLNIGNNSCDNNDYLIFMI